MKNKIILKPSPTPTEFFWSANWKPISFIWKPNKENQYMTVILLVTVLPVILHVHNSKGS